MLFFSDNSYRPEHKKKLIEDIEEKLKERDEYSNHFGGKDVPPSSEYERLRRRVYTNTQEMWNYVQSEVIAIRKTLNPAVDSKVAKQIEQMLDTAAEHKRSLLNDLNKMREVDGYEKWRLKESIALSSLVQRRLTSLQHPEDCSKAQKLVCRLNKVSRKYNFNFKEQ